MIVVILAAGEGKRMNCGIPKVLLPLLGQPILKHVIRAARALKPHQILVVGRGEGVAELVAQEGAELVVQPRPMGTADAVRRCERFLARAEEVVVMCGDAPLITGETLSRLRAHHLEAEADATLLTAVLPDPSGYGRILRGADGVLGIVEERDAPPELLTTREVNSGCYIFRGRSLLDALARVGPSQVTHEYYLTDVIPEILKSGGRVSAISTLNPEEILGVNTFSQYEAVVRLARQRLVAQHFARGVIIRDPISTHIDLDVRLDRGTVVNPFSILEGKTQIGKGCEIGPFVWLRNARVGDRQRLAWVVVDG